MSMKQWLVEFKGGVGYTFDSFQEALLCACEFVLERAKKQLDNGNTLARSILDDLSQGHLHNALGSWNSHWSDDPVIIRTVEQVKDPDTAERLKTKAVALLKERESPPVLSLFAAIKHTEQVAQVSRDDVCSRDHNQLATWLNDLVFLRARVQDWVASTKGDKDASLIEAFSSLKGYYLGDDSEN